MSPTLFNSLSAPMKIEYLVHHGEVIAELEHAAHYTSLFLLENFYVQTRLSKRNDEITWFKILEAPGDLYQYVAGIDLGTLQNVPE